MMRQAVLVVEYGKESGRPIDPEVWGQVVKRGAAELGLHVVGAVRVEVQEDEPA